MVDLCVPSGTPEKEIMDFYEFNDTLDFMLIDIPRYSCHIEYIERMKVRDSTKYNRHLLVLPIIEDGVLRIKALRDKPIMELRLNFLELTPEGELSEFVTTLYFEPYKDKNRIHKFQTSTGEYRGI